MINLIDNVALSTNIFTSILVLGILFSLRRKSSKELFPLSVTQELKGLAILMITFSHIGYFLVSDHRFLYPLTTMAGVGVNLFLFLSGFGLATSALKREIKIIDFFKRRFIKLYLPLWIVLAVFLLLDFFLINRAYSWSYIFESFIGFFPSADLYTDFNSPFWYLTLLLFYYAVFPFVFMRKHTYLSALIIYLATYFIVLGKPTSLELVMHLYEVHILAFPLGIVFAKLLFAPDKIFQIFNQTNTLSRIFKFIKKPLLFILSFLLLWVIYYMSVHSGIGEGPAKEQYTSIITLFAIVFFFIIKPVEIRLLYLFGFYSYEIYLLHWPLMARHDIFYAYLPGWLATVLYLALFVGLAWCLRKISVSIEKRNLSRFLGWLYTIWRDAKSLSSRAEPRDL